MLSGGVGGGEEFVFAVEGVGEPVAEEDGADGKDFLDEGSGGVDGARESFVGSAGGGVFEGVGEDLLGAGGFAVDQHGDFSFAREGCGTEGWVGGRC